MKSLAVKYNTTAILSAGREMLKDTRAIAGISIVSAGRTAAVRRRL